MAEKWRNDASESDELGTMVGEEARARLTIDLVGAEDV
jgi:hypothetical protein